MIAARISASNLWESVCHRAPNILTPSTADFKSIRTLWHRFVCILAPRCPDIKKISWSSSSCTRGCRKVINILWNLLAQSDRTSLAWPTPNQPCQFVPSCATKCKTLSCTPEYTSSVPVQGTGIKRWYRAGVGLGWFGQNCGTPQPNHPLTETMSPW